MLEYLQKLYIDGMASDDPIDLWKPGHMVDTEA